jgi:ATP-binding cassette subfamily B multidrug efflux pump
MSMMRPRGAGAGPARGPMGGGPMAGFGMPVEKPKDFKGTLKRFMGYLKPYTVPLVAVFVAAIISTIFNILSPKILGQATTKLFEGLLSKLKGGTGVDFTYILHILIILAILYVIS